LQASRAVELDFDAITTPPPSVRLLTSEASEVAYPFYTRGANDPNHGAEAKLSHRCRKRRLLEAPQNRRMSVHIFARR